jgi:hypothetical protein
MGNTKRNRSKKNSSLKKFENHLDLGFLNPVKSIMKGGVTTSTILNNGRNNDFDFVDLKTYLDSEDEDAINKIRYQIRDQISNQQFIDHRDMVVITIDVSELDKDKNSVLCLTDGSSKKYILLSKIDKIQSALAVIPRPASVN